ncbi:hypothetical protein NO938_005191 [Citrobacter freundii]|jgi:hypothetical protein|nr:hypothetical protein [Citrobacter freundii]EKW0770557.1 hypothetical protein [Citrobacter freundii]MBN4856999.1 hypothetical protein [Citrobacter freundii]
MEKISFAYVSQIYPGKVSRSLNYPQPWIRPDEVSGKISIDISFGLIIKTRVNYRIDIDIFYGEKEIEFGNEQSLQTEPIVAGTTSGNESVSIENMSIMNVDVKDEGIYRVRLTLHLIDEKESTSQIIHSNECFFFLSKEWKV